MFWPVFSFASAGMNAGTTFDMGSRHTSLPPITSSRNASLYHATLPPVRITTGTLMAAKLPCAALDASEAPCSRRASLCRNQRMFSPTTMPTTSSTPTTKTR